MKHAFFSLLLFFCARMTFAQVGFDVAYVYGPKKESFGGRIYAGPEGGVFMIGIGGEYGKFNSTPTDRVLNYYSLKLGIDFSPFQELGWIYPYFGGDFEYLKTTRVVDHYRVSIVPKLGIRFFNVLFVEATPDNIREPEETGRIFKFNYNSFRILMGFHHYFGGRY